MTAGSKTFEGMPCFQNLSPENSKHVSQIQNLNVLLQDLTPNLANLMDGPLSRSTEPY